MSACEGRFSVTDVIRFLFALGVFYGPLAVAQCAPGIPSAGNPGCIPPNQQNSPCDQPAQGAPVDSTATWADRWGAIAMDPHSGVSGLAEHETSKAKAVNGALSQCSSRDGVKCEVLVAYYNQCIAVAQRFAGGPVQPARSPDLVDAKNRALDGCGGSSQCTIMYSSCSFAERVN